MLCTAFNCKYISFVRDGLNLGKNGYTVNVSVIISAIDPNKCVFFCWIGACGKGTGCQRITTRSVSGHEKPRRTWTRSSVDALTGCPLGTGMRREDVDCGTMWVSPHPLLASHRHYCDGTTLCHDLNSCVQDDWMCTWLHIPMTMTLWIFMDGTIT